MKKSFVVLMIMLIVCSGFIFAAGGGQSSGKAGSTAAPAAKTDIRWIEWKSPEIGAPIIQKMISNFNAQNPEYNLTNSDRPFNGFYDNLVTQAQARNLPEILLIQVDWVGAFAKDGIIQSIDPMIAKEPATFMDQYYDAFKQTVGGKKYYLPIHSGCVGMFYDPAILSKEGISAPPATWDELLSVAKKVTHGDQYAVTGTLASEPPTNLSYDIYPLLFQAGGKLVDANMKPAFNSPEGVKALEFYKQLVQYSVPGVLQNGEAQKRQNFPQGKVAMMFEGPWGVPIQTGFNKDHKFIVTTLTKGVTTGTIVRGSLLAIPTTTTGKKLDGAWAAIKYLSGPEGSEIYCSGSGDLPANKIAAARPFVTENPYMKGFLAQMDLPNANALPHLPYQVELNRLLTIEIQQFISGNKTAQKALDDAAAKWNELLSK